MNERESAFAMRLNGAQYLALPDGHRTTLVVGMIDMLELASTRFTPVEKPKIDAVLTYARSLESDQLRQVLDEYLNKTAASLQYAIASNFIVAITEKTRLSQR